MTREPIGIHGPKEGQQIQERRQSEASVSLRQKAARFDEIIRDAHFAFEHWSKLYHARKERDPSSTTGCYEEGAAHAYTMILWFADMKPECPCPVCTETRMIQKESIIKNLEAEGCARVGETNG